MVNVISLTRASAPYAKMRWKNWILKISLSKDTMDRRSLTCLQVKWLVLSYRLLLWHTWHQVFSLERVRQLDFEFLKHVAGINTVWLCNRNTLCNSNMWMLQSSLVMYNILWMSSRSTLPTWAYTMGWKFCWEWLKRFIKFLKEILFECVSIALWQCLLNVFSY